MIKKASLSSELYTAELERYRKFSTSKLFSLMKVIQLMKVYHTFLTLKNRGLDLNLNRLSSQVGTQFLQIFVYNTEKGCNPNCQVPSGITVLVFHVRRHGEVERYPLHRPGGI